MLVPWPADCLKRRQVPAGAFQFASTPPVGFQLSVHETNLRKERQLEGIAKAKASGVYKGRKPSIDVEQVRAMKAQGVGPAAIGSQDRPRISVPSA
jgi:hypothetical protein